MTSASTAARGVSEILSPERSTFCERKDSKPAE
jgi:hypothetical protein